MIPATSVLDLIGNTPMLDVSNLSPNPNVRIVAKLESQNPFGSVKDRIAKNMIEQAEKEGSLYCRSMRRWLYTMLHSCSTKRACCYRHLPHCPGSHLASRLARVCLASPSR